MNISVVITCFNEAVNIGPCLETLIVQDYDQGEFEIVVVDGGSIDKTQEIVQEFEEKFGNVRLVVETKKGTAAGRNAGIAAAGHEYIAFIDGDCEAPKDWLSILQRHYSARKAECEPLVAVGGRNIPPESTDNFVRAIGVALDTYIGSFNSTQGRQFDDVREVSSLATVNVLYDKRVLEEIDGFDETLGSEAEDAEMNYRLKQKEYRMLFIPESYVWHKMRPTPRSWWRNMFRYGKGRARLLKRYPAMWSVAYVLPLLFLAAFGSLLAAWACPLLLAVLVYFPVTFIISVMLCLRKKAPRLVLTVMIIYWIQHFGYALGEAYGLFNPKVK